MATIVNRRLARCLGPAPARGPGASLDALTWVGWASVLAAFGFLVFGLRPLAELGDPAVLGLGPGRLHRCSSPSGTRPWLRCRRRSSGASRGRGGRTPWLMRGVVLLALEQLARPVLEVAREQYFERVPAGDRPVLRHAAWPRAGPRVARGLDPGHRGGVGALGRARRRGRTAAAGDRGGRGRGRDGPRAVSPTCRSTGSSPRARCRRSTRLLWLAEPGRPAARVRGHRAVVHGRRALLARVRRSVSVRGGPGCLPLPRACA